MFPAVYLHPSLAAVAMGGLPLVFGMTMCAGLFEMLLSQLLRHLRAIFPTVVCGFIVMAVGIEHGLIAGLAAALRTIGVITTCQRINER